MTVLQCPNIITVNMAWGKENILETLNVIILSSTDCSD